jgi:DNA-binding LytR/AlgR family response regulator
MKKIQCIIVDDEPLARELVDRYISRLRDWEAVARCRSVADAYEALYQNEVDVIFLDINMPDKSGIEFLSTLKNPPADYLVKPITEERFREAVEKVERLLQTTHTSEATKEADHIFLKQDNRLVKLWFDDILYIEASKDFSKVYLKERTMLASAHLKLMEDMLPTSRFIRVHRSFLVALDKISALQGNTIEIGKQEIPIGTTYKEELLKRLKLD